MDFTVWLINVTICSDILGHLGDIYYLDFIELYLFNVSNSQKRTNYTPNAHTSQCNLREHFIQMYAQLIIDLASRQPKHMYVLKIQQADNRNTYMYSQYSKQTTETHVCTHNTASRQPKHMCVFTIQQADNQNTFVYSQYSKQTTKTHLCTHNTASRQPKHMYVLKIQQ